MISDPAVFGWIWPLFGIAAASSTALTSSILGNLQPRRAWAYGQFVMAFGVALPAVQATLFSIIVSAICVGGTFMVITMAGMQEARRIAAQSAPRLMAAMTAAFAAASLLLMYVLVRSPFGKTLVGIRERELRMRILGYNTWLHKYLAFIIAGGFGGLAGVLWAHTAGIVSPENLVLTTSVDALLMAVLGGAGTLVGGVIGAFIVFGLREYLSTLVPWWQYALGAVYVLTILYLPWGLMGIPERIRQRRLLGTKPVIPQKLGIPA
jgi:ABC-type branched-subunit amino acid transport system permease subunit